MRSQKLWCVLVCCCLVRTFRSAPQHHVDYMQKLLTIKGLFDVSDVVVFAQITGRKVLPEGNNSEATHYPVIIILERFKGPVKDHGPGLTVRRGGGVNKATSEVGFPAFEAGDKYVLFLKDGGAGQFSPHTDRMGLFWCCPRGRSRLLVGKKSR